MNNSSLLRLLKSSIGMSAATLLSRILGLVRTILEAAVLGGGSIASEWGFAIIFPNIFRRLLGEGALGTALIPLISGAETEEDRCKIRRKLGVVFTVLGAVLVLIVILTSLFSFFCGHLFEREYVRNAFDLVPYLMPYAFFICLIGIGGACLSTRRVFFLPAAAGLLLNIFIISTLGYFYFRTTPDLQKVLHKLTGAVLFSGVIQLIFIGMLMKKNDIFPEFNFVYFKQHKDILSELWHLALPGLIAGSALQLSLLIDKSIAVFINANALPSLSYSERIVYLPVGVFALSVGSVLMADMSHSAASGKYREMVESLQFSLRHVIYCCIPMSIFVIFFRTEIIEALFLRGQFTLHDLKETSWAMLFYCTGIPFFCAVKVITPAFFARKDMKTPMKVSLFAIVFNIILNFVLMWPLKQGGLALATVLSSVFNNTVLLILLHRSNFQLDWKKLGVTFFKTVFSSGAAVLAGLLSVPYLVCVSQLRGGKFAATIVLLLIYGIVYLLASLAVRAEELHEFLSLLKKRGKKN